MVNGNEATERLRAIERRIRERATPEELDELEFFVLVNGAALLAAGHDWAAVERVKQRALYRLARQQAEASRKRGGGVAPAGEQALLIVAHLATLVKPNERTRTLPRGAISSTAEALDCAKSWVSEVARRAGYDIADE